MKGVVFWGFLNIGVCLYKYVFVWCVKRKVTLSWMMGGKTWTVSYVIGAGKLPGFYVRST